MNWERFVLRALPLVERLTAALVERHEQKQAQRSHYFPTVRLADGRWSNADVCSRCGVRDPERRLFTRPACGS